MDSIRPILKDVAVDPTTTILTQDCLQDYVVLSPDYMPVLLRFVSLLHSSQAVGEDLIAKNKEKLALENRFNYRLWKLWHASESRKKFVDYAVRIAYLFDPLNSVVALTYSIRPTILKNDATLSVFEFWKNARNILGIDRTVSYYTLVERGKEYDFPFDISMMPAPLDATTMSQESRLVLTDTIIGLMKDFSSETMSDHIVAIITYLKGNNIEQKAKEWELTIRESRTRIEPTDAHKHAIRLDRA